MKKVSFKEYQEILMNSFEKINIFMDKNNIKWWAHSGTLLGAVRNSKIIDWDDDIDMTMTIYDWNINKSKIEKFLIEMNWKSFDSTKINGLDATRFFSNEFLIVEYNNEEYITKPFIDVMLSIPKNEISIFQRKIWSWFNQYNLIFAKKYRLIPYYGWFGKKVKKINWFINFLVFFQKIILLPFTFWVPILQKRYLKKKNFFSENVAMYYNYDNKGVIYNVNKINTKHKFGKTFIYSNDKWKEELDIWFGKDKWLKNPPKNEQVPHHILLTKKDGKNDKKYKISPYIFL